MKKVPNLALNITCKPMAAISKNAVDFFNKRIDLVGFE